MCGSERSWPPNETLSVRFLTFGVETPIEHGYAVENIIAGAPERVLFTQEAAANERELTSLSRNGREVSLYTSDGSSSKTQGVQNAVALPQQQPIEAPANVIAPEPVQVQVEIRRSIGR